MKVLLIGSGGREHAICHQLSQSSHVQSITTIPGNPGTHQVAKNRNLAVPTDATDLLRLAKKEGFDLTVVGPEKPLCEGLVDRFRDAGLKIFGPTKAASQLESSKCFAKDFMQKHGIPTAGHHVFQDFEVLENHLKNRAEYPVVLKADGLASGKGVAICTRLDEALNFARACMIDKKFGSSGETVVVEEYLEGTEASFLVFASGTSFVPMDLAKDHKKLLDHDQGPNTGGMGAYCPAEAMDTRMLEFAKKEIISKTLAALNASSMPFTGVLYAGLMLTKKGPKVLEFNVRFGDPETQVILPRLRSDLFEVMLTVAEGAPPPSLNWDPRTAVGVVLASKGYPENPLTGHEIRIPQEVRELNDVIIFHAGTSQDAKGRWLTSGGRVMTVTALADTLERARQRAYEACEKIKFEGKTYRKDIGVSPSSWRT